MQEIIYELSCDDCGNEYTVLIINDELKLEDSPIFCPFCGTDIDFHFESDSHDEINDVIDELDELDFDDD